jgi:hypothetical protein
MLAVLQHCSFCYWFIMQGGAEVFSDAQCCVVAYGCVVAHVLLLLVQHLCLRDSEPVDGEQHHGAALLALSFSGAVAVVVCI